MSEIKEMDLAARKYDASIIAFVLSNPMAKMMGHVFLKISAAKRFSKDNDVSIWLRVFQK